MAIDWELMSEAQRGELVATGYRFNREPVLGAPKPKRPQQSLDGTKRKSKYNAQRTEYNGVLYDSKAEARHAQELDCDPNVKWWLRQVMVPLGPDFSTRVDFVVGFGGWPNTNPAWSIVRAHEIKGAETREFKRVRVLWPKYAPFQLTIIKKADIEIIEGKD